MKRVNVSVIIPVYNSEKYISDCIESVLSQSYKGYELILVDDGSTDNSPKICDAYAQKYNFINVYHKQNGGAATARNLGIDKACGEYLMFVDGDDMLHPNTIELLLKMLEAQNADLAMCHYRFFDENPKEFVPINIENDSKEFSLLYGDELLKNFTVHCRKVSLISLCMKLFKREIFDDFRIPEGFIEEDSLALPYILERSSKIVKTDLQLYFWRNTPGSVTRAEFSAKRFAFIEVSFRNAEFFALKGYKKIVKYYRKEFLKRCLEYYYKIPRDRVDLYAEYTRYKTLYKKYFLSFWLTDNLCITERLAYLVFLFSPKVAKKMYMKVYGEIEK